MKTGRSGKVARGSGSQAGRLPPGPTFFEGLACSRPAGSRLGWAGLNISPGKLLALLETEPEIWALTSGSWSVLKLLELARERVGWPTAIDLWSWTVSRRAARRLSTWRAEGVIVRAVVDASLRRRQPAYAAELEAGLEGALRWAAMHAKLSALIGPWGTVVVAGSGNVNFCRRAELVILSKDPALAAWIADLTDRLFATLPAGAPAVGDEALAHQLARTFPPTDAPRPAWAEGLPVLGRV